MGQAALNRMTLYQDSPVSLNQGLTLLLIFVLGTIIAVADGLTRPEMLLDAPVDTFTYAAVWGAWALAVVMFPICLLYAKEVGSTLREGVFLWFVLGMVIFGKSFSYIRWPGTPIFITDVVLFGFLVRLFVWPRRYRIRVRSTPAMLLLLYFGVGVFTLARSVLSGHIVLLSMRDFAITYYSLFAFVGFAIVRNWASVQRFFLFFLLGAVISCADAMAWFLHRPEARRYLSPGDYVLAALLGTLVVTDRKIIRPVIGYGLAVLLAVGVILANARTVYVEAAVMLLLMMMFGPRTHSNVRKFRIKAAVGLLAVVVGSIAVLAQTSVGSKFIDRSVEQLLSGTLDYQEDPNAVFRLAAWGETLSLTAQHPVLGIGFGVILDPFTYMLAQNGPGTDALHSEEADTRPHNTYLTVLYQMGLVGFVVLMALFLQFFRTGWKILRRLKNSNSSTWLYVALIVQLTMVFYGGFNLFLESPFSASIFWLTLGVGWRIQYLMTAEKPAATGRRALTAADV